MDDGADFVGEDGVILILAVDGEAAAAAAPQAALVVGAEIPAARTLQDIAAEGGDGADLRARRSRRGVGQRRVALAHDRVRGHLLERRQRADAQTAAPSSAMASRFATPRKLTRRRGARRPRFIKSRRSTPPAFNRSAVGAASFARASTIAAAAVVDAARAASATLRAVIHSKRGMDITRLPARAARIAARFIGKARSRTPMAL